MHTSGSHARSPSPTKGGATQLPSLMEGGAMVRHMPNYSMRTATSGAYNSHTLAKQTPKYHTLDFSYMNIRVLSQSMHLVPRVGTAVKRKKTEKQLQDEMAAESEKVEERKKQLGDVMLFGEYNTGRTKVTEDGFVVMKAMQETYAYRERDENSEAMRHDMLNFRIDSDGNLIENKSQKDNLPPMQDVTYHCSSLRLDSNKLQGDALKDLSTFVHSLCFKPSERLVHLDLSFNSIVNIPELSSLQALHTLLLHSNKIESVDQVKSLQGISDSLRKLTLHSNPAQEKERKRYKFKVLFNLPFLTNFDDARVTTKDREALVVYEQIFVTKKQRGTTRRLLLPSITPSPVPPDGEEARIPAATPS